MKKILSLMCIVLTVSSCASVKENSRQVGIRKDPQEQAIERAWALYRIGETKSALKVLEKIANSRPLTLFSVEAVVLSAEIYLSQKQGERAIDMLSAFEKRAMDTSLDLSRVYDAKFAAKRSLKRRQHVEPPIVVEAEIVEPEVVERAEVEPLVETSSRVVSNSVGVLLPLSGPYKVYGERALTAMRLSLENASSRVEDGATVLQTPDGFSLVVMDTKGQNDIAKQAVDMLVDTFNVGVIVGDILSDTALAIAQRSNERDVVNLSLSRKDGITALGPNIYRLAVTAKKQTEALLRGVGERQFKRIAILYPENAFGVEMRNAFVAEAKKSGANIVKIEGYNPNQTTFTAHIKRLVGAEFDALFLPDFPKSLGYIIPALIAEGVMVSQNPGMLGAYRRTSRLPDAEPVQLLGPSSWNSIALGEKLGTQIDGALFVDSANLLESRLEAGRFSEGFKQGTASSPSTADALAFDAIGAMRQIFQSLGKGSQVQVDPLLRELQSLRHSGISGEISFDENRESNLPFQWFSFQDGQIHQQS